MKTTPILFGLLLSIGSEAQALSYDDYPDGKRRNSWEQQQETYRKHGYDTYQNGPLPETLEQQRREERRQEEYRRDTAERQRQESYRQSGGNTGGWSCKGLYGC